MTYYADLTTYEYTPETEEERHLVNIGWLAAQEPFPTADPEAEFVSALGKCALRPVRLYRGFHACDLCTTEYSREFDIQGRTAYLGNGEIQIDGPGATAFCAPTLVLHYVQTHHYAPPKQFVDAVMAHVDACYFVLGDDFDRIRSMSRSRRYTLLLATLERLARDWKPSPIPELRAGADALHDHDSDARRAAGIMIQKAADKLCNIRPPAEHSLLARATNFFQDRFPEQQMDGLTASLVAEALELTAQAHTSPQELAELIRQHALKSR